MSRWQRSARRSDRTCSRGKRAVMPIHWADSSEDCQMIGHQHPLRLVRTKNEMHWSTSTTWERTIRWLGSRSNTTAPPTLYAKRTECGLMILCNRKRSSCYPSTDVLSRASLSRDRNMSTGLDRKSKPSLRVRRRKCRVSTPVRLPAWMARIAIEQTPCPPLPVTKYPPSALRITITNLHGGTTLGCSFLVQRNRSRLPGSPVELLATSHQPAGKVMAIPTSTRLPLRSISHDQRSMIQPACWHSRLDG